MTDVLRDILTHVAHQMETRLAEIRMKFSQSGDKGACVEVILREFLSQYLPRRLAVGHGEIVDSNRNRTGQTDVVIVNEDHPFTFTADNPGFFFVEGISAGGEIKTVLNTTHLASAIAASRRFKALRLSPEVGTMIHANPSDTERFYQCPPYFLFAFESEVSFSSILDTVHAAAPDYTVKPYPILDAIFVLNKGWAVNFGDGAGAYQFRNAAHESLPGWIYQPSEEVLYACLVWLYAVMPRMISFSPVIMKYMFPGSGTNAMQQEGLGRTDGTEGGKNTSTRAK